jgi:hypothetical protein
MHTWQGQSHFWWSSNFRVVRILVSWEKKCDLPWIRPDQTQEWLFIWGLMSSRAVQIGNLSIILLMLKLFRNISRNTSILIFKNFNLIISISTLMCKFPLWNVLVCLCVFRDQLVVLCNLMIILLAWIDSYQWWCNLWSQLTHRCHRWFHQHPAAGGGVGSKLKHIEFDTAEAVDRERLFSLKVQHVCSRFPSLWIVYLLEIIIGCLTAPTIRHSRKPTTNILRSKITILGTWFCHERERESDEYASIYWSV